MGIIGTGDVAERKGGPALYRADRSELVAVTSRTLERARAFAQRHGNPQVHPTADMLLADPELDAVYIATHPDSHAELTARAAKAGKHVLCEKPMAMTIDETERMIAVCRENKVSLSVAFYRRAFPVVVKLKELLDEGRIGRPLSVHINNYTPFLSDEENPWRLDPACSGGGILMDVGSHRLDLMSLLFGAPAQVQGIADGQTLSKQVDDAAVICLRWPNQVLGSANFHWNTPIAKDDLTVVGTEGTLSVQELSGQGELTLETAAGKERWTLPAPSPVHLPLVQQIVDHLLDGGPNPCSGEAGAIPNAILRDVDFRASSA